MRNFIPIAFLESVSIAFQRLDLPEKQNWPVNHRLCTISSCEHQSHFTLNNLFSKRPLLLLLILSRDYKAGLIKWQCSREGVTRTIMLSCLSHPQTLHCQLLERHFCVAVKAMPDSSIACAPQLNGWESRGGAEPQAAAVSIAKAPPAKQFPTVAALLCKWVPVSHNFSSLVSRPSAHCSSLAFRWYTNAHSSTLIVPVTFFTELFTMCLEHPPAHKTDHVLEAYTTVNQWSQRL